MARSDGIRPWFRHFEAMRGDERLRFAALVLPLLGPKEEEVLPSLSAERAIDSGTGDRQSRSPIRWSSQILSEKGSIPGERKGLSAVKALRCERRNMFDFPTMHGATATAEMAV